VTHSTWVTCGCCSRTLWLPWWCCPTTGGPALPCEPFRDGPGHHPRGKQPKLNPRQEAHLVVLHRAGEHTTTELADLFGVARSTVYRAIQREAEARLRDRGKNVKVGSMPVP
jgi:hypothetical protein